MSKSRVSKPNFLIIGACKSGTTSAYEYLKAHPQVFMPEWKEPEFFVDEEGLGVESEEEYLKLFDPVDGEIAIGEASVNYLYHEDSPGLIDSYLGKKTKFICLLRNPVDMVHSLWNHHCRTGVEKLSFEQALEAEEKRLTDPTFQEDTRTWVHNLAYKRRGLYFEQLKRYDEIFPSSQLKVFIFEEFFRDGLPQFYEFCQFLGIDHEFEPEKKKFNASGEIKSKWLYGLLQEARWWKKPLKYLLPVNVREKIKKVISRFNRTEKSRSDMASGTRNKLREYFEEDVRKLEHFLGRDLKELWF